MTVVVGTPTFGWQSTLKVGTVVLTNASALNVERSRTTEEVDIMAAEDKELHVYNKLAYTITFTIKAFNCGVDTVATQVTPFKNACVNGTAIAMTIDDVTGQFICTKCSENKEAGKVVSYSIELKPTLPAVSNGSGGSGSGGNGTDSNQQESP